MARHRATNVIFAVAVILAPITVRADRDAMLHNFANAQTMVVLAGMEIVVYPRFVSDGCEPEPECIAINQVVAADVEYYAAGDEWRLNSYADPLRYPDMDTEIAWNGGEFQYFMQSAGLLDITTGHLPQSNGVALPMLLFALLEHFMPPDDANPTFSPRLADVRQVASARSHSEVEWTTVQVDGRTLEAATFPGGILEGTPYDHVVYVRPLLPGYPVLVHRVNRAGQILERITFTGYDRFLAGDGTVMYWPTTIEAELLNRGDGTVRAEMKFIIRKLSVNDPAAVPPGIFNIDWTAAERVFLDGERVQ